MGEGRKWLFAKGGSTLCSLCGTAAACTPETLISEASKCIMNSECSLKARASNHQKHTLLGLFPFSLPYCIGITRLADGLLQIRALAQIHSSKELLVLICPQHSKVASFQFYHTSLFKYRIPMQYPRSPCKCHAGNLKSLRRVHQPAAIE